MLDASQFAAISKELGEISERLKLIEELIDPRQLRNDACTIAIGTGRLRLGVARVHLDKWARIAGQRRFEHVTPPPAAKTSTHNPVTSHRDDGIC